MQSGDRLEKHFRLKDVQKKALSRLGVETVRDLLYHFPTRYEHYGSRAHVKYLEKGEKVTLYGTLNKLKTKKAYRSKIPLSEGVFSDETGEVSVVWFNQPHIAKTTPENTPVKLTGSVGERREVLYLSNPHVEKVPSLEATGPIFGNSTQQLLPVYKESRGVTSRWFFHTLGRVLKSEVLEALTDPIPPQILKRYNLPKLTSALIWIHQPRHKRDAEAARKRFAFEEVFSIQLIKQQERKAVQAQASWEIPVNKHATKEFIARFPFTPTRAQNRAVQEILKDIGTPHAMSRLLEGDVGSGKTFVAATTAHAVVTTPPKHADGSRQDFGNLQVAYMAPTEILAQQHFESFIEFFKDLPIQIGLITGSGCKKYPSKVEKDTWTTISRTQLLKWVANGEIPILIGTHSLIQKTVTFKHLAYIIIDEQHRFGVNQRSALVRGKTRKENAQESTEQVPLPHLLSMTATPIPRTLALTIFGDLDLTLLDELPKGRREVITEIVQSNDLDKVYKHIEKEVRDGRQAYIITPRIDEPDPEKENALRLKSAKAEAKRLQEKVFPKHAVGLLHGKMTAKKKEEVMSKFAEGKINVLVATSVVEVGVNVPNATIMLIEGAERFGLAQLHQLRGRILRSSHQAYCYLNTTSNNRNSHKRLKALKEAKNGFELAEMDLKLRGAGELTGGKQWGITDVGMEAIKNIKMVEAARNEAKNLIENDPELNSHKELQNRLKEYRAIHFE